MDILCRGNCMVNLVDESIPVNGGIVRSLVHDSILWICLAVLLLRLFLFFQIQAIDPGRALSPDSPTYQGPARALVELGRFSQSPEAADRPEVERTPGYPLFIALSYARSQGDRTMLVMQIIVSVAAVAVAGTIAREVDRKSAGALAALLLALDPISLLYSQMILSDGLFAFMFSLHVLVVLRLFDSRRKRWLWALATGLTLAIATHVRPITYYFIVPLLITIIWAFRRGGMAWKRSLLIAFLIFIAWAPTVLGWQWRNYRLTGVSDFSAIQDLNLFLYRGAGIVAQRDGISAEAAKAQLLSQAPLAARSSDIAWYAYCRREGLRLIQENPLLMLKDQVRGAVRMLLGPGIEGFEKYFGSAGRYVTVYSATYLIAIYALVAICVLQLLRQQRLTLMPYVFLTVTVVYLVGVSAGPEAYSRFRLPIMPILAVCAARGWNSLRGC